MTSSIAAVAVPDSTSQQKKRPTLLERWDRFWFAEVPSEAIALVRIAVGLAGLVNLIGFTPVELYWMLDGLAPLPGGGVGLRQYVLESGFGPEVGWGLFLTLSAAFTCMTVGLFANTAVLVCFIGSLLQVRWNSLPHTAGQGVLLALLFCLIWADLGARLSLDYLRARRAHGGFFGKRLSAVLSAEGPSHQPIWPIRLIRAQIALIYLTSGLFKLFATMWREGSAVYYTTGHNIFGRILNVYPLPPSMGWVLTALTYATLLWELGFFLFLLNRATRRVALVTGVAMHLGIFSLMEVGPFTWMMLAAYVAFLDPHTAERLTSAVSRHAPFRRR